MADKVVKRRRSIPDPVRITEQIAKLPPDELFRLGTLVSGGMPMGARILLQSLGEGLQTQQATTTAPGLPPIPPAPEGQPPLAQMSPADPRRGQELLRQQALQRQQQAQQGNL